MNYLSTLSEVEVEEYQASAYPESRFSVRDLSGIRRRSGMALGQVADEIAKTAIQLVKSGRVLSVDVAVQMAIEAYCADGRCAGGLSGLGDDQAILDAVVNDARATQATHKLLIDNLAAWPDQPVDDATRRMFSNDLSQLEQDFTNRGLQTVGIQFPYQLDRVNPAHAIILAVRDDIKNTVGLIDSRQMQIAIAKEVRAVQAPVTTAILETASQGATALFETGRKFAEDVGEGAKKALNAVPYIVGAVAVAGLLIYSSRRKSS